MSQHRARVCLLAIAGLIGNVSYAGGLRSLVALPLEPGGVVARLQVTESDNPENTIINGTVLYGLSKGQTLIVSVPYRHSALLDDGFGYITALYRRTVYQHDEPNATRRIAILAGVGIPTDSELDPQVAAGAVATIFRRRSEWDIDVVWLEGLGRAGNNARYDVSWQYRLTPAEHADWGLATEWQSVVELGGRYRQGSEIVHALKVGALWVHPSWVLEAGIMQDLNGPDVTAVLLGIRKHF